MRIVSLSPAATEVLFALGCAEQLVGVDQFSNFPEEAKRLHHLRGHNAVDVDAVRALTPDLILTATVIQEKLAHALKDAGLPVVHQDPRTLDQVWQAMKMLGELTDRRAEASALMASCVERLNAVRKRARMLPERARVYVEEWHDPPMASGNWVPELVRAAGGEPFPIPAGQLSRAVTLEEVRAFDPRLIVISWCGAGSLADPSLLTSRPGWEGIDAVRERHVIVLDDSLFNRPGPRLVEGAERLYGWLFQLLH